MIATSKSVSISGDPSDQLTNTIEDRAHCEVDHENDTESPTIDVPLRPISVTTTISDDRPVSASRGQRVTPTASGLCRTNSDPPQHEEAPGIMVGAFRNGNARSQAASLSATAPVKSLPLRLNSLDSNDSNNDGFAVHAAIQCSKFSTDYFFAVLEDGPSLASNLIPLYTERDLMMQFASISAGLSKSSDLWEDRVAALSKLQALVCTDALDFDNFSTLLRDLHELVRL